MNPKFKEAGRYDPEEIFSGDFPVVSEKVQANVTVVLKRGAFLVSVGGADYVRVTQAAVTGGAVPDAVLAHDVSDLGVQEVLVYRTGQYAQEGLDLGDLTVTPDLKAELRRFSIYLG
ncbi:hypothetical protein [Kiloniella laminariae]|uniref:hypothetical protein n=1 Tax=Kiloniella laminariae TaxID=454162 RepID=UPI00036AA975|nr:hypothetical protein [Kiloniella laminariae]